MSRWRWLDLAWALGLALTLAQGYTLLHDLGQALAARVTGLQVLGLQPWLLAPGPVRLVGDLSGRAGAWAAVGGSLLPWLVVTTALALARPRRPVLRLAAVAAAAGILLTLVPWWVAPLAGRWPGGHDALRFLARAEVDPWTVATFAGLAAVLLAAAALRSAGGAAQVRAAWPAAAGVGRRWPAWLALALVAAAVVGATWSVARGSSGATAVVPPAEFTVAADVRLTSELRDDQLLGDLAEAPHALEVWVEARDVRGPLQVDLVGPDGERVPLLTLAPDGAWAQASARTPALWLEPGPWSVRASSASRGGRLLVGWRTVPR